jgi:hypothetical protein
MEVITNKMNEMTTVYHTDILHPFIPGQIDRLVDIKPYLEVLNIPVQRYNYVLELCNVIFTKYNHPIAGGFLVDVLMRNSSYKDVDLLAGRNTRETIYDEILNIEIDFTTFSSSLGFSEYYTRIQYENKKIMISIGAIDAWFYRKETFKGNYMFQLCRVKKAIEKGFDVIDLAKRNVQLYSKSINQCKCQSNKARSYKFHPDMFYGNSNIRMYYFCIYNGFFSKRRNQISIEFEINDENIIAFNTVLMFGSKFGTESNLTYNVLGNVCAILVLCDNELMIDEIQPDFDSLVVMCDENSMSIMDFDLS